MEYCTAAEYGVKCILLPAYILLTRQKTGLFFFVFCHNSTSAPVCPAVKCHEKRKKKRQNASLYWKVRKFIFRAFRSIAMRHTPPAAQDRPACFYSYLYYKHCLRLPLSAARLHPQQQYSYVQGSGLILYCSVHSWYEYAHS